MIAFHEQRKVLIHVPRTGGVALSEAVQQWEIDATVILYPPHLRHATAEVAARKFPGYEPLMVMRNPFSIVESMYRLCSNVRVYADTILRGHQAPNEVHWCIAQAELPFSRFVADMTDGDGLGLADSGGFYNHYSAGLPVRVFQFSDGPHEPLLEYLGLPGRTVAKTNWGDYDCRVCWTPADALHVARYCRDDIKRFGYRSPL